MQIINRNAALCDNMNGIKLRVLDYGHANTNEEWTGNIVSPMYARLYYILGGNPFVIIDGKRHELDIGKCYLFPTGFSFRHACASSMEQIYFHINLSDADGVDLLRAAEQMMEFTPSAEALEKLKKHTEGETPVDSLRVKQLVYSDLLTLFEKYSVPLVTANYSKCVRLAIKHIKKNLNLRLSVKELAATSFVSESTLSKKFKAEVGTTIGSYIDGLVLFEAEQMLLKTELSVQQISERFGFCDQFYFSRRFKNKYGETPQKYRKLKLI